MIDTSKSINELRAECGALTGRRDVLDAEYRKMRLMACDNGQVVNPELWEQSKQKKAEITALDQYSNDLLAYLRENDRD